MIYFVGAGPGAVDLITLRGRRLLDSADVIIYAGSLVNKELLKGLPESTEIYDSAYMNLEEITSVMIKAHKSGKNVVRLHTGDQSIYGAVREQMDILRKNDVPFESVPGVSSFCAAAASLNAEYTLPNVSQTVILTRMEGATTVPKKEDIENLAKHRASIVIFLSVSMIDKLCEKLIIGGYDKDTPAAIVYKASWPDEIKIISTLGNLAQEVNQHNITKTALVLVGDFLGDKYELSKLYDADFEHGFRKK